MIYEEPMPSVVESGAHREEHAQFEANKTRQVFLGREVLTKDGELAGFPDKEVHTALRKLHEVDDLFEGTGKGQVIDLSSMQQIREEWRRASALETFINSIPAYFDQQSSKFGTPKEKALLERVEAKRQLALKVLDSFFALLEKKINNINANERQKLKDRLASEKRFDPVALLARVSPARALTLLIAGAGVASMGVGTANADSESSFQNTTIHSDQVAEETVSETGTRTSINIEDSVSSYEKTVEHANLIEDSDVFETVSENPEIQEAQVENALNQEINQQVETENRLANIVTLSQFSVSPELTLRMEQALGQAIPDQGIAISIQQPLDAGQLGQFLPVEQLPDLTAVINQQNQAVQQIRQLHGDAEILLVANRDNEGMTVAPIIRITEGISESGIDLPATSLYLNTTTYLADVDRSPFGLDTTPVALTITPERQRELAQHNFNGQPLSAEVGDVVIAEIDQNTNRIVSIALQGIKFTLIGYEAIATGSDVNFRQQPTLADVTSEGQPNVLGQDRQFEVATITDNYQEAVASLPQAVDQNSHGWSISGDMITYRDPEGQQWVLVKNNQRLVWVNRQVIQLQITPTPQQEPTPQPPIQATLEPTPVVNPDEGQATPMPTPAPGEPGAPTPSPVEVANLEPLLNLARTSSLPQGVSGDSIAIHNGNIAARYQYDAPAQYRYQFMAEAPPNVVPWRDLHEGRTSVEARMPAAFFETYQDQLGSAIIWDVQNQAYTRTISEGENQIREYWRPGMTADANDLEGGWYRPVTEYRSSETGTRIVLEFNAEGGFQTNNEIVYRDAEFTEDFTSRIESFLARHTPNLQGKNVIISLLQPGTDDRNSNSVRTTLQWNSTAVEALAKTEAGNTIQIRLYSRGANDWFRGEGANEELLSTSIYHALLLANYQESFNNGAIIGRLSTEQASLDFGLEPYHPDTYGQRRLQIDLVQ